MNLDRHLHVPTYRALARYALAVARSHWTHALPRIRAFAWELAFVAVVMATGAAFGVQLTGERVRAANARHVESLRRLVPVAEACLVAHGRAVDATTDTLEMLEWEGP